MLPRPSRSILLATPRSEALQKRAINCRPTDHWTGSESRATGMYKVVEAAVFVLVFHGCPFGPVLALAPASLSHTN